MTITHGDMARFTEGDCHYLARAINLRTGWPIYCFTNKGEPDLHAFVCMPDGCHALDIHGVQTMRDICARWQHKHFAPFTWRQLRAFGWEAPRFGPYTYRRAHVVAGCLLEMVV